MKIRKAIIPVGGFGTRLLPATKAQPKEMLTVVDKPVIQYLVEEAVAAGIEEIVFVTSRHKKAIEDHFDHSPELETALRQKGKNELADEIHKLAHLAKFTYVRQKEMRGPGDALLEALHLIGHNEPVAVLYGDDLIDARVPALKQMMKVYEKYKKTVLALVRSTPEEISKYASVAVKKVAPRTYRIYGIVEKPKDPASAPSNLASIGKYIYSPEIIALLPKMKPGVSGELWPTDIFDLYIRKGGVIYGYEYDGTRYDTGQKIGYLKAIVAYGLKHPGVGKEFKDYLKGLDF